MTLEPLSHEHLCTDGSLPFNLYTQSGQLLLAAGQKIRDDDHLAALQSQPVYVDDGDYKAWRGQLEAASFSALHQNAYIGEVGRARAQPAEEREATARQQATLGARWEELVLSLEGACRDPRPGAAWRQRIEQLYQRARSLVGESLDGSLYYLLGTAAESSRHYSSRHALVSMLVAEHAAALFGWADSRLESVGRAALTMNASMARLQDRLAETDVPLSPELREVIRLHPLRSHTLLRASGVEDELWLEAVRTHHDVPEQQEVFQSLPPGVAAGRLLRRADIFTARLSCRSGRPALAPSQAAREHCLGPDGRPDILGQALLKVLGLYPPGSFVELQSGEIGVVLGRGERATLPRVASLVSSTGAPMADPLLRDTLKPRFTVLRAVPPARVKVRLAHDRLMAMI